MSWDSYIDNLIGHTKDGSGTPSCDKVSIIGIQGGAPWTSATHANALKLSAQEGATIAKCFQNKDFSMFMSSGVVIEGTKYQFLRVEDDKLVLAKKKDLGALTLVASKQTVVIAHTVEGGQQGNTNKGAITIAEYLESSGY